jgi:hypothetical protein
MDDTEVVDQDLIDHLDPENPFVLDIGVSGIREFRNTRLTHLNRRPVLP